MSVLSRFRPIVTKSINNSSTAVSALSVLSTSITPITSIRSQPSFSSKSTESDSSDSEYTAYSGRQYELSLLGNFPDSPAISPYGTIKSPALIYSGNNSRIVGCIGGGVVKHRLLWFELKVGPKHVCSECGQVFKLVNDNNYKEVEHLIDSRTKQHMEYYGTLKQLKPNQIKTQQGPHSRQ